MPERHAFGSRVPMRDQPVQQIARGGAFGPAARATNGAGLTRGDIGAYEVPRVLDLPRLRK